MKKYLSLIAVAVMLTACNTNSSTSKGDSSSAAPEYDRSSLSILTPTGAPALAFYNYAGNAKFETNSAPATISGQMAAGSKDVIVLPTNAGVKAIVDNKAPYQLAATITFGNFYIASLNNDDNQVMDENDVILLFQKNNVPDKIFHYVYGDQFNNAIHYAADVSAVAQATIAGKYSDPDTGVEYVPNYVMIAEPALTNVLSKKNTVSVYADIQAKYKEKSNDQALFQASVFVKNTIEKTLAKAFLESLEKDINDAIADPTKLSAGMNKEASAAEVFGVAPQMAENVLKKNNGMGLGFKYAGENKAAVETFLKLFNIEGLNEEIYF